MNVDIDKDKFERRQKNWMNEQYCDSLSSYQSQKISRFSTFFYYKIFHVGPGTCKPGYECIQNGKCNSYQKELKRSKKFGQESQAKKSIIENLKSLVCNKEERKVCCKTDYVSRSGK